MCEYMESCGVFTQRRVNKDQITSDLKGSLRQQIIFVVSVPIEHAGLRDYGLPDPLQGTRTGRGVCYKHTGTHCILVSSTVDYHRLILTGQTFIETMVSTTHRKTADA